jgi:murein DD-endopeptidase MepM/ murein hydrolase activator NlpD
MGRRLGLMRLPWLMVLVVATGCGEHSEPAPTPPKKLPAANPQKSKFRFPTDNRALLRAAGEDDFFTPTGPGRSWRSGSFGCVRNTGTRIHEGIDIRALRRDENGEATDSVHASRDGKVAHINSNIAASNYGKYIVLKHEADGLPVYTLYAHLNAVADGLEVGRSVKAGESVGILGRTSNTGDGISKERAHLHFEIGLQIHTQFESWFHHWYKGGKNHHGAWNGMNLLGLDAAEILRAEEAGGFDLASHLSEQPVLCRVRIHQAKIEWADRFPELVIQTACAETLPAQAWEVDLNFNAIPIRLKPLYAEGLKAKAGGVRFELLEVNDEVRRKHPCRSLIFKKGARWVLTTKGQRALDLLAWPGRE